DWKHVPERELATFAQQASKSGAASVTAWGAGSFGAQLAFEGGKAASRLPMACYKPDELDNALYYFLEDVKEAVPGVSTWVAVVVENTWQRDRILEALGNPGKFIDQHI